MDTLVREPVRTVVDQPRQAPARPALPLILIGAGLAMIPWLFFLAASLPSTTQAAHWDTAWVGLDTMEALGLASTGLLLCRRDRRAALSAAMTAVLLLVDAWFDVTTAASATDRLTALAMAGAAELPIAALLLSVAFRSRRNSTDVVS